jgi:hypothetical protein
MTVLIYAAIGLLVVALATLYNSLQIRRLRYKGVYPQRGYATMQHVENLARSGKKVLAIRAYREVHGASLKQAKEAVEKISAA